MKKILIVIFTFSLLGNTLFAQNADFKHTLGVQYGASIFNLVKGDLSARLSSTQTDSVKFTSAALSHISTIGLSYDYGVKKWFSIGLAASYNQAKASLTALEIKNNKGVFDKLGDFSLTIPRTTVAARFLFHYGNKGKIDCYSGFRLGVGIWSVKTSGNITSEQLKRAVDELKKELPTEVVDAIPAFDDIITNIKTKPTFTFPQVQLILFGIRGYVTKNIGISAELAAGSPYAASIGANYRF